MYPTLRIASLAIAALFIAGCASTTITAGEGDPPQLFIRPQKVIVHDFAFNAADISREEIIGGRLSLDSGTSSSSPPTEKEAHREKVRDEIGQATAEELTKTLVEGLRKMGLPAERGMATGADSTHGDRKADEGPVLSIIGQFVRLEEGDAARRIVVGIGAGHSEVDSQVQVYVEMPEGRIRFVDFGVAARSGHRPGLLETIPLGFTIVGSPIAVAATAGAISGADVLSTAKADARRMGKAILRYLAVKMYREGWIDAKQAKTAGAKIKTDS